MTRPSIARSPRAPSGYRPVLERPVAFLIPENLRSRADLPPLVQRVAIALRNGLDDDAIVWFEPLFDARGSKPHFVVLMPDNGIAVVEVLAVRPNKLLGSVRGRLRIVRENEEADVEQPLARAESFAATLRERIAAEPRLEGVPIAVAAAAVFPGLERSDADEKNLGKLLELDRCIFGGEVEQGVAGEIPSPLHRWFVHLLGASSAIEGPVLDIVRGLVQPELVIDLAGGRRPAANLPSAGRQRPRPRDGSAAGSAGEGHRRRASRRARGGRQWQDAQPRLPSEALRLEVSAATIHPHLIHALSRERLTREHRGLLERRCRTSGDADLACDQRRRPDGSQVPRRKWRGTSGCCTARA